MTLTDYSPGDDEPTFEQIGTWHPSRTLRYDADGSIVGCAGGHPFGRNESRYMSVEAGQLTFRCAAHLAPAQISEENGQ